MVPIQRKSVAIYCASRREISCEYTDMARQVGLALGRAGYDIIWGGCHLASMGAVADGAREAGAKLHGVVLSRMVERGYHYEDTTTREVVETLSIRIDKMSALADAFVVLPGGIGTLEELVRALSEHYLQQHYDEPTRPIVILGQRGYGEVLRGLFGWFEKEGFVRPQFHELYVIVDSPEALVQALNKRLG